MYETFEHTADLGIRVKANDLNTLFAEAGQGVFSTIVENFEAVEAKEKIELSVAGSDTTYLLFDWLSELIYIFESRKLLLCKFDVKVNESGLTAEAWGEPLDSTRHRLDHEVKAITYHHLTVEQTATGWRAEVIVDI